MVKEKNNLSNGEYGIGSFSNMFYILLNSSIHTGALMIDQYMKSGPFIKRGVRLYETS